MSHISFSVQGKHVLISGGCGGIGSTLAYAILLQGAHMTVTDLKPPQDDLIKAGAHLSRLT
jgi:NAD(P)-dependent dehydrogenase (short-subunit alcohol dehydrogenase family)